MQYGARILKFSTSGAMLGLTLLVSGCGAATLGPATAEDQQALAVVATESPKLYGGEKIRITVYGEDKLTGDYDVDPSGYISLPLAGAVKATGLTQPQLEQELAKKFKTEYLKNPKVTVSVLVFRPFYVMGEVEKRGEYPYKPGLNALSAIAIAGGPTYRANRSKVLIQHLGEDVPKEYPMSSSVPILPGDLIRVPERYF